MPIILGRPFLATAGAKIDVKKGLLNLIIGDDEVEFQFNKTMKGSSMDEMVETVFKVDEVDEIHKADGASEATPHKFVEESKEVECSPGFLPRPNDHKVYAIGEDDYAFWDLLFGDGRKKEREKWRSLKAHKEDSGGTIPEVVVRMEEWRQPKVEINASCSKDDPS